MMMLEFENFLVLLIALSSNPPKSQLFYGYT